MLRKVIEIPMSMSSQRKGNCFPHFPSKTSNGTHFHWSLGSRLSCTQNWCHCRYLFRQGRSTSIHPNSNLPPTRSLQISITHPITHSKTRVAFLYSRLCSNCTGKLNTNLSLIRQCLLEGRRMVHAATWCCWRSSTGIYCL